MLPPIVGKGPGIDLLDRHPTSRADLMGLSHRPGQEHLGALVGDHVVQVRVDDVPVDHPADGPVVHASPGADVALWVTHHHVGARPQTGVGHLGDQIVRSGTRPTPSRALVGAEELGEPAGVVRGQEHRVPSLPGARGRRR